MLSGDATRRASIKVTKALSFAIALYAAATAYSVLPAAAQNPFPEAPARDTLFRECSQCHSIGKVLQAELTGDDWEFLVYDMIARGAPVHAEDIDPLVRYLRENFSRDDD